MSTTVLEGFAGPGGWDEGARILRLTDPIVGIEINEHAVTAAVAAGHQRVHADIRDVDPADHPDAVGAILSSPCPTFGRSGLGTGRADLQLLLDAVTHAGSGCGCDWADIEGELDGCVDPRTALAAQCIRWALQLPNLQWIALEQVPTVETMFEDIAAELMSYDAGTGEGGHGPGWESVDVFKVDALRLGMPVRRERLFLVGRRYDGLGAGAPSPAWIPDGTFEPRSWAQVLGWDQADGVRTRGNRRPTGGGRFAADGPGWCLTGKARSWERESDGLRLTPAEAGLLQGFRADYPWAGSRTAQFQQAGDVVLPPVAAAVLGYATGTPWVEPVRNYLTGLYGPAPTRLDHLSEAS